jgi:predicted acetyltransferase
VIELVRPTVDLSDSWWDMVDEFEGEPIHGSSFRAADHEVLHDPVAFEEWVDWLGRMERADELPEGRVPWSTRWIVEDGRVVGTIALRHALNASLLMEGGHVGYAVRPAARRRGVASAALGQALRLAARRRIDPVLVTCDDDNIASARTIESHGGVLEDVRDGVRRYWVATGAPAERLSVEPVETLLARLVLVTPADAEAMLGGQRRAEWAPGYPREDDLDAVRMLREPDPWSPRHVVRRSDSLAVGSIGCFGPPDERGTVEVGYGLVPEARGTGLMTDVLSGMCRALAASGLVVVAHTAPDNVPSHRVLARLGFVRRTDAPPHDGAEWLWERRPAQAVRDS